MNMKTTQQETRSHLSPNLAQLDGCQTPTFESEIRETPDALRRLLNYWRSVGREMAAGCVVEYRPIREVIFTGMGSSLNAAYPAKYLLARHGIAVRIEPASELLYSLLDTVGPESLVIAASQSGETIETNKVVAALKKHRHVLVLANDETSCLATSGRPFFDICAGHETRTSSKTYTNTLALLYLIAEQVATVHTPLDDQYWDAFVELTASTLTEANDLVERMLSHWTTLEKLQVVARGPSLATALEFALILAENTNILVQPVDGGGFRHGFNYMAGEGHNVLFLMSESPTASLTTAIASQIAEQGSRAVVLSSTGAVPGSAVTNDRALHLPLCSVMADLAPICEILPLEMLALRLAERQGRDPGKLPHKITREE